MPISPDNTALLPMSSEITMLVGMIVAGSLIIALLFMRAWKRTGDRLLFWFAVSFLLQAANRAAIVFYFKTETHTESYILRLLAFLIIIWAIMEKNFAAKRTRSAAKE